MPDDRRRGTQGNGTVFPPHGDADRCSFLRIREQAHHSVLLRKKIRIAAVFYNNIRRYMDKSLRRHLGDHTRHGGKRPHVGHGGPRGHTPHHFRRFFGRRYRHKAGAKFRVQRHPVFYLSPERRHKIQHGPGQLPLPGVDDHLQICFFHNQLKCVLPFPSCTTPSVKALRSVIHITHVFSIRVPDAPLQPPRTRNTLPKKSCSLFRRAPTDILLSCRFFGLFLHGGNRNRFVRDRQQPARAVQYTSPIVP